jgi:hypothetical protein
MAETDVTRLNQDVADIKADLRQVKDGQRALAERVARLEGLTEGMKMSVDQIDRRLSSLTTILLGSWVTLALAVLGLYFKG